MNGKQPPRTSIAERIDESGETQNAPLDRAPSKHERKRIQLDWVLRYAHQDELGCNPGYK